MRVITFKRLTAGSFNVKEEVGGAIESTEIMRADAAFRRMSELITEGFHQDLTTSARVLIFQKDK